jgi:PleD family two-component response regulator
MDRRRDIHRRFGHMFASPLTALRGAAALLRQRAAGDDPVIQSLFETLQRSLDRIQRAADLVDHHASFDDEGVTVRIAGELLPGPGDADGAAPQLAAPQPSAPHEEARAVSYEPTLLLVLDISAASLAGVLRASGYSLLEPARALDSLDLARTHRPALIVLDLALLQHDARLLQVLQEDPETKAIPLLFLAHTPQQLDQLAPSARGLLLSADAASLRDAVEQALATGHSHHAQPQAILVVDDEEDIRRLLALELEAEGFRVAQATCGTEALLRAQQQRFDLIILDLMLPDLDGFAVLGGLRARAQTALTPIILVSALNAPQEKVQGFRLGADDYITKPFSLAEVGARVRAAIRRSELEGSTNPSTRLPGNIAIERAIARRIEQGLPFAVCYCDLDNFKSYNDSYGFLKGDAVIHQTAHVLVAAVERHGNSDDFVGHIGGDDFVLVTTPDRMRAVCAAAIAGFDALAPLFYDPAARERGYIEGVDRRGRHERFPLVSISIMIVTNERAPIHHMAQVAQRAIELKKIAKRHTGSIYILDDG